MPHTVHTVLLIEDDPKKAVSIQSALTQCKGIAFRVEWVRTLADSLLRLPVRAAANLPAGWVIDIVLLKLRLPDSTGVASFDRLHQEVPHVPILVLVAATDQEDAQTAVMHGAEDYFLTDVLDVQLLSKTVRSMVQRAASAEALYEEKERAQVTLDSIGDAVVSTDVAGNVIYLNLVAERMTGWSRAEAAGQPVEKVLDIIDATSHKPTNNPIRLAMRENKGVALTLNCTLRRRDGVEVAIEDSAAPIHNRQGRVIGAVMVFHDVSVTRALSLKMSYLAQHDSLTDLPNRLLFSDRLTQAIALAERHKRRLGVLFLDIDRFKQINDSLGHAIGDRLLQSVAERMVPCVRHSDTVSRQGGDEFVLLLPEVPDPKDAAIGAEKILLALMKPYRIDSHEIHITASIGIAVYPEDGRDAETLMQNADFAMYHAKESGRNGYQFFTADMNVRAVEWRSLEAGMRHALSRQEFVLHYQPKVDLQSGAVLGVEALVRWHHPQRGLLGPSHFIPIAEIGGSIVTIGRWVLREACRQATAWQNAGLPPMLIAVNISAVELRAKGFVATVRDVLIESGLDARYLELELTETFLMQDPQATAGVLRSIKDLGVQLSLDDFGTGYSSLSYLRRFPIDTLKIDQSFVRDLVTDADDASIVSAMISMGKNLHMQVIAEGVETPEQVAFLQARACPGGQGYYFCRPLLVDEVTQFLSQGFAMPGTGGSSKFCGLPSLGSD